LKPTRSRPPDHAFEELLSQNLGALYRTAVRLCEGELADAEDLLQDAALRAFQHHHELRETGAGRAWLFTILTRTHLNRLRSTRRRSETVSSDLTTAEFEDALASWRPMDLPDEAAERAELGQRLARALDSLDTALSAAVWLVDVEGFSQREVADIHDVPEGTIASRLFRARRQLRTALESGNKRMLDRGERR
jgi:RNA polymerase sigma-70 factor (ECF subfamily)